MTTPASPPAPLYGMGPSFETALEIFLRAAVSLVAVALTSDRAERSVRFRAEAATREDLVRACLVSIMDQIADFDVCPVAVTLDGVRTLDLGYRAWGSLSFDVTQAGTRTRLELTTRPEVRLEPQHCHISANVTVIHQL